MNTFKIIQHEEQGDLLKDEWCFHCEIEDWEEEGKRKTIWERERLEKKTWKKEDMSPTAIECNSLNGKRKEERKRTEKEGWQKEKWTFLYM